jgi:sirohydrochlorin ferrochelatase
MIINDKVTEIVCVPYFLSPGKHSTVDVPNLIAEAKLSLEEEGLLHHDENDGGGFVNILTSQALGTQLEFMLGGVDELVNLTLKDGVDN